MWVVASHRTYLGVLLGLAVWALFRELTGGQDILDPLICMLVTMWVAGAYEPGKMATLGVAVGFPAGLFIGVQDAVQNTMASAGFIDLWIQWALYLPLTILVLTMYFAVTGLACGSVAQLYKRKAIF